MKFFCGIHELVCKRADGKLYVSYFDDEQKALASIDADTSYFAAWYSLNSLSTVPETATLNGPLVRSNRSKKDWIARRQRLLIDLDPIRQYGNASESEKAAAQNQAVVIREYLISLSWPQPMLCDSGNGYHLIYALDLPNDQSSEDLVRGVLLALAARLDTTEAHVDCGNFEGNRLCKLPGSWARKAPSTPERPHRQACILEAPELKPYG